MLKVKKLVCNADHDEALFFNSLQSIMVVAASETFGEASANFNADFINRFLKSFRNIVSSFNN